MGIISGVGGAVDGIATVRKWSVNPEADIQAYVASNTKGATGQVAGNTDWSGSYDSYGHTPTRMPGEVFSFQGDVSSGLGVRGECIVDDVEISDSIEDGTIIQHVVNFSGNAPLQRGSFPASDVSLPNPPTSIATKVTIAVPNGDPDTAIFAPLEDTRGWTLRLATDNQGYVSSETVGGMKRLKGNLSGEVTIPIFTDDFSEPPPENQVRYVRLYVTPTLYWELIAVMFSGNSGPEVDIEAGAIVGVELNGAHTSHHTINSAGVEGRILKPGLSPYWPF